MVLLDDVHIVFSFFPSSFFFLVGHGGIFLRYAEGYLLSHGSFDDPCEHPPIVFSTFRVSLSAGGVPRPPFSLERPSSTSPFCLMLTVRFLTSRSISSVVCYLTFEFPFSLFVGTPLPVHGRRAPSERRLTRSPLLSKIRYLRLQTL